MKTTKIKGFTIIELVVAIGIITMLSGMLIYTGREGRQAANIDRAATQLEAALKEAQAFGKGGRAFPPGTDIDPTQPELSPFDRGYGVYIEEGGTEFYVYGGRGNGDFALDEIYQASNVVETITFRGGVQVFELTTTSPGGTDPSRINVLFRRGANEVYICRQNCNNASQKLSNVTITLKSGDHERFVTVNKQGLIFRE